ncbi:MAG: GPR endopeptidase [Vulcanibacillus sp.]
MKKYHNLDLNNYQVRTDLALERHQMAEKNQEGNIPGVDVEEINVDNIHITKLMISSEVGSEALNKPIGEYLTFEASSLKEHDSKTQEKIENIFAQEFKSFLVRLNISDSAKALVIGLGNWNVTPDALGPKTIEKLLITRHLFELMPEQVEEGFRPVSAFSPGVMGLTGIETSEIVCGVIDKSQPDFLIVIDALASRSLERVNTTIQIANTGIQPGSGVGNKRKALDEKTLGIPVIAIGVPTVVDAVTITNDTIEHMMAHLKNQMEIRNPFTKPSSDNEKKKEFFGLIGSLEENEKRQLIHEVLSPLGYNLIVTPKEVDIFIEDIAKVIANGLNLALHQTENITNSSFVH